MSAFSNYLRDLANNNQGTGDEDYWIERHDQVQVALQRAAEHIEEMEVKHAQERGGLKARIEDLELLFTPFLRHFLKMTEPDYKPDPEPTPGASA